MKGKYGRSKPYYGPVALEIQVLRASVRVADFTDNLNTTGYIDITPNLPIGSIPLGWKATVTGAFTGDVSAVIQVGIAGTLAKYSANTAQSIFTTGVVGSMAVALDSATGLSTEKTVRVTVTSSTDFTLVKTANAGALMLELYYIKTI
jgi:hypothetical protein